MICDLRGLFDKLQPEPEHTRHTLHIGKPYVHSALDVANGRLVVNAGQLGEGVPSEAPRFTGRA